MARKKRTNPSQDADTMIRRYIEDQDPAEDDIQEEFTETRSFSGNQADNNKPSFPV